MVLLLCGFAATAMAQERRPEIDPNTKIEGGADLRSSGASAGAGARMEGEPRAERGSVAQPEPAPSEKDKPTIERKPQERSRDDSGNAESRTF